MDRTEAKEYILEQEPSFLQPARERVGGHTTYICPSCGNGSGEDGTGIEQYRTKSHKIKYHCFNCGLDEDNIGLWKIDTGVEDDREAFEGLYGYYGIQVDGSRSLDVKEYTHKSIHTKTYTQKPTQDEEEPEEDYTAFFSQANKNLDKTEYHRGISTNTLNRFMVGYVEMWKHPKAPEYVPASPRLIIPTSRHSYIARDVRSNLTKEQEKYKKQKVGKVRIFNSSTLWKAKEPIFVTEGEINALSIIDVGGEAVALGSTSCVNMFVELVKDKKPVQPLILALDNDKNAKNNSGRKAQDKLGKLLGEAGISYYEEEIYPDGKDANEKLQEDRTAFTLMIRSTEKRIMMEEKKKETEDKEKEDYLKTSTANYIQDFIDGIADSVNTPYIPTGFTKLDNMLDGGLFEGLYIIGAISSLGKTSFIEQVGDQMAETGQDILYFSLEMARSELMAKSISRLTLLDTLQNGIDRSKAKTTRGITTGKRYENYSQVEKDIINRSTVAYSKYADNIYIWEGIGSVGTKEIRSAVSRHISLTGKRPVLILDYLQILEPADPRATDKQNMDKAVLELKRISRDFKIPVIAISSLNRMSYKNEVTMEAFKESGAIEYSSDVLIGLQLKGAGGNDFDANTAKQRDPREIELRILKNRNGATGGKIEFEYYSLFNYFREV